jgi:hypothetical protein
MWEAMYRSDLHDLCLLHAPRPCCVYLQRTVHSDLIQLPLWGVQEVMLQQLQVQHWSAGPAWFSMSHATVLLPGLAAPSLHLYSICKEILPVKYDFFLDEMIRLHNIQLVEHLRATGQYPHNFYLQ